MQPYINNPAMNMYKKRERTQNWNHQEKKFLLDLCRKDMRIIENKRLDAGLTAVKNKAWKIIHHKFSIAFGTDRTCNRLKEQWRRMKACTRNEIMDYNNRLARFGTEIADRKKPSSFTFEVWDFMQEAKKVCKSEALDGIDYSKIPLALEEDFEYREDEINQDDDNDLEDSRTPPQELCDIDIKEETNDIKDENADYSYNDLHINGNDRLSASPNPNRCSQQHNNSERGDISIEHGRSDSPPEQNGFHHNEHMNFPPAFNMNNISATLEALNALRTGQFPAAAAAVALQNNFAAVQAQAHAQAQAQAQAQVDSQLQPPQVKRQRTTSGSGGIINGGTGIICNGTVSASATVSSDHLDSVSSSPVAASALPLSSVTTSTPEMRAFMDMQSKEHFLRMKILEVQLQAARYNRDIVEINKTIALQKLQDFASKRMS